jgi:putative transposase
MDNINFHKSCKVKTLIDFVVLFLPIYSPYFNFIEHYWFKIKNDIKKTAKTSKVFFDALYDVLKNVFTLIM